MSLDSAKPLVLDWEPFGSELRRIESEGAHAEGSTDPSEERQDSRSEEPTTRPGQRQVIEALPVSARPMARFDREKLYQDVWKAPLVRVSEALGVLPSTLSRVCKALHVPIPGIGYWTRKCLGQAAQPQPLLPPGFYQASNPEGDQPPTEAACSPCSWRATGGLSLADGAL